MDSEGQVENTIERFQCELSKPELRSRLAVLDSVQVEVASSLENFKPGQLKRIVRESIHALIFGKYSESKWISKINGFIRELSKLQLPFSFNEFIAETLRASKESCKDNSNSGKVVDLVSEVVSKIGDLEENVAVKDMILLVGEVAESVLGSSAEIETKLMSNFCTKCRKHYTVCIALWSKASYFMPIISWMTFMKNAKSLTQYEELKTLLIDALKKRIQLVKPGSSISIAPYSRVISHLNKSDWIGSEGFESILIKLMKKIPEGSASTIAIFLSSLPLNLDLSSFVKEGAILTLIRIIRSQDETIRFYGITSIQHITIRCFDSASYTLMVNQILESLQGKGAGGTLTEVYQKGMHYVVLKLMVSRINKVLGQSPANTIASELFNAVLSILDKETVVNYKLIASAIVGILLSYIQDVISTFVTTVQKSLEKANNAVNIHYLLSISQALQLNKDSAQHFSSLAGSLSSLVKESTKKVNASNIDAVLAYSILIEIASASSTVLASFESSKLWNVLESNSNATSILYNESLIQTLTSLSSSNKVNSLLDEEIQYHETIGNFILYRQAMIAFTSMLVTVSKYHISQYTSLVIENRSMHHALILYSLCDSKTTRDLVQQNIAKLTRNDEKFSLNLLKELLLTVSVLGNQYEANTNEILMDFKSANVDDSGINKDTKRKTVILPPPSRISTTILHCLPLNEETESFEQSSDWVVTILTLVTNPLVAPSFSVVLSIWNKIQQKLKFSISKVVAADIVHALHTNSIASSQYTRKGSHQALQLLSHLLNTDKNNTLSDNSILLEYVPLLSTTLKSKDLLELTSDDMLIYTNPEQAIRNYADSNTPVTTNEDIEITNADRKKTGPRSARRGQFGNDLSQDEDWAERVKAEKAAKLAANKSTAENTALENARAIVNTRRERILQVINDVKYSLETIESLVVLDVNISRLIVAKVFESQAIQFLLQSALLNDGISCCLYKVSKYVLEPELKQYSRDIIDSIRLLVTHSAFTSVNNTNDHFQFEFDSEANRAIITHNGPILRVLRAFQLVLSRSHNNHSQEYPLTSSTFHFIFVILLGILSLTTPIPGSEFSFHLFDSFWPSTKLFEASKSNEYSELSMLSIRSQLNHTLTLLLKLLAKPGGKIEPSPEKVFQRIVTQQQLYAFTLQEWNILLSTLGLLHSELKIRLNCINAIVTISQQQGIDVIFTQSLINVDCTLFMMQFDESEDIRGLATQLWNSRRLIDNYMEFYQPLLKHNQKHVRDMTAKAISGAVNSNRVTGEASVLQLQQLYTASCVAKPEPAKSQAASKIAVDSAVKKGLKGDIGNNNSKSVNIVMPTITKKAPEDTLFSLRAAIGQVFEAIGTQKSLIGNDAAILALLDFIIQKGVVDSHNDVRNVMLSAGRSLIDNYGLTLCSSIFEYLERVIATKPNKDEILSDYDNRHSAAVVLLGATGKHLDKENPALISITETMITALNTPSESVQRAVADSLTSLATAIKGKERAEQLMEQLIQTTLEGNSYGERRGAAFGLSAFVKGVGIVSLKQHNIVTRLTEACMNGSVNNKQGSLFAFECLSERIGLLFEPYIITIIPALLKSFSHSSDHVRDAANAAAKIIMSRLSAHGVKQVLTPILTSLPGESQWKSRQEAIRLLGMMAHCAPKQLAACLPQIVPCLVEAGSDPHPKVKESAKAAMADVSSVIKNPEVSRLSPVLLGALGDPANKTKDALDALLECEFMHSVDPPSLALLVPILGRALKDRAADIKRKASAITGYIVSMVSEAKALTPYLPQVIPGLKNCLMDPIPDVRSMSAKALGSLFCGCGEEDLNDIIPWLITTLSSESSPVERSGAAQGLSEICGKALDTQRVADILQKVLKLRSQAQSAAREGLLWFLSFLPITLDEAFSAHISTTLPVILSGLSDENEGVREVAMRSGQVIVSKLGLNHTLELLPSLTEGMFNDDWRIRQSSVKLLGELLYLVGDTKGLGMAGADGGDDDEEENSGSLASISRVSQTIRAHIGDYQTNYVLASLYIARADIHITVRQVSLQIWKSIVSNTPRTLVEVMPILVKQLIDKLSSDSEDMRLVAGRALGEIVSKLGDKVLPTIIPHMRQGLKSESEIMRQGVCAGLAEILSACTKKQAEDYTSILVPAIQQALCDSNADVSSMAARAFMTLFKAIGTPAIDEIVPSLLAQLAEGGEEGELALNGLKEIVAQRPRDLVEYLLPALLVTPIKYVAAKALGSVMEVAGGQLNYHFQTVIPAFVTELCATSDNLEKLKAAAESNNNDDTEFELSYEQERFEVVKEAASKVMGAVVTSGVNHFISELGKQIEHETNVKRRRWGCWLAEQFVSKSKAEYKDYVPILLKYILSRVAEFDKPLLHAVHDCLVAITTVFPPEDLIRHVDFMRSCISSTASTARHRTGTSNIYSDSGDFLLPLFTLPKSLDPLLNVLLYGLMNSKPETREVAAETIGELALMTDVNVLKPLLIKTTGPLIRVIGDRFPSGVKSAILKTLCVLLDKGSSSLKAFVPQLQTTFVKSLNDPSREVRTRGCVALGKLIALGPRIDPLLNELTTICTQAESNAIKCSVLDAIDSVLIAGGEKATSASLDKTRAAIIQNICDLDDNVRSIASKCLSNYALLLDASQVTDVLIDLLEPSNRGNNNIMIPADLQWTQLAGRIIGVAAVLQSSGQRSIEMREEAFNLLQSGLKDDRTTVKAITCNAIAQLLGPIPDFIKDNEERKGEFKAAGQATIHAFANGLAVAAGDVLSGEVRTNAITAIKQAAKNYFGATAQHLPKFLPPLVAAVKDINIRVKYVAERALKHLSEGKTGGGEAGVAFNNAVNALDSQSGSFIREYVKKTVSRMTADSDDENNDKW